MKKWLFVFVLIGLCCNLFSQGKFEIDSIDAANFEFKIDKSELDAFMFMSIGHYTLEGVFLVGSDIEGDGEMVFGKIPKTKKLIKNMVKSMGATNYNLLATDTIADNVGEYIVNHISFKRILVVTRDFEDYKICTYEVVK